MKKRTKLIIIISSAVLAMILLFSTIIVLFYKITYDPFDISARKYISSNPVIEEEYGAIRHIRRNLTNKKEIDNDRAKIAYSITLADGRNVRIYVFFQKTGVEWEAVSYEEIKNRKDN